MFVLEPLVAPELKKVPIEPLPERFSCVSEPIDCEFPIFGFGGMFITVVD